jgi:hypothetical protein
MAEVLDSQPSAPGWEDLRQRILEALDEDPVNEGALVRHLDGRDDPATEPAQRVLATLLGLNSAPAEASRFLETAIRIQQEWAARRRSPVPLRLVLLDLLLQENRRRASPLLTELRVAAAPSTGRGASNRRRLSSACTWTAGMTFSGRPAARGPSASWPPPPCW